MKVKILNYIPEENKYKKGIVDLKIIYNEEKNETFRGMTYFEKDGKKWLNFLNVKRDDKWLPAYERSVKFDPDFMNIAIKELEDYISNEGSLAQLSTAKSSTIKEMDI